MKYSQCQSLLTEDQFSLNDAVIKYLLQLRKEQKFKVQSQAPSRIPKSCNLLFSIAITIAIIILNFNQLFPNVQKSTQLNTLENYHQLEKNLQYVFQHTIMRYSVIYKMKMQDCEQIVPLIKIESLCSQKSIDVKTKLVYGIGYRPNYQNLRYISQNNSIQGEWGPLQILNVAEDHQVESQINGFINQWSVIQFEQRYQQKIEAVKPLIQQKINQYIENITSNRNQLIKLQQRLKNSLMKIVNNQHQRNGCLSDRILKYINKVFDQFLIFMSMNPLLIEKKVMQEDFSSDTATEFYKEQIFTFNQDSSTNLAQMDKNNQNFERGSKSKVHQVQKYDSDQIRLQYNKLQQKIR